MRVLALTLALIVLSASCALAQAPAKPLPNEIGAVYIGGGQALAATPPRLLTKNARVSQFVCAPTGTRIAYTTSVPDGQNIDESVGIVTPGDGSDTVFYHRQDIAWAPGLTLDGWSDDAAYFAFSTSDFAGTPTPAYAPPMVATLHIVDLVHHSMFDVPLPFDQMVQATEPKNVPKKLLAGSIWSRAVWSPGHRVLALTLEATTKTNIPDTDDLVSAGLCLYDPDKRTCRLLFTQQGELRLDGWKDATHIVYHGFTSDPDITTYSVYDLATGKTAAQYGLVHLARATVDPQTAPADTTRATTPSNQTLAISESSLPADSGKNEAKASVESLWLTRSGGRAPFSEIQIDAFPPAKDDSQSDAQFLQNGGFDRGNVYHIVYESEGDLKEVDIVPRGATPEEKVAGDEPINCDEEVVIAQDYAKRIGLGILQYAQDYNETLPAGGDGFHDEIKFYTFDSDFTLPSGVKFQYTPPASLKLADMDSPASDPLGEFDLPCRRVVLEGDGHVKALAYPPAGTAKQ